MSRYAIEFSKEGYIKYTSHLDMLRLFKRSFKKAEIKLKYSQGFNPHPKMSFAQPLSLGYLSTGEILEFETMEPVGEDLIKDKMFDEMPAGIEILRVRRLPEEGKTLAALTEAAEYKIMIPNWGLSGTAVSKLVSTFLKQDRISVTKFQRKTGKETALDIRPMIRSLEALVVDDNIIMTTSLDSGSSSNLSPELLITAFATFSNISLKREEIEIMRTKIFFIQ